MTKVHLVIPDPHAHPDHNNNRADWLGQLILDLKPDVVVNLGDVAGRQSRGVKEQLAGIAKASPGDLHLDGLPTLYSYDRQRVGFGL